MLFSRPPENQAGVNPLEQKSHHTRHNTDFTSTIGRRMLNEWDERILAV